MNPRGFLRRSAFRSVAWALALALPFLPIGCVANDTSEGVAAQADELRLGTALRSLLDRARALEGGTLTSRFGKALGENWASARQAGEAQAANDWLLRLFGHKEARGISPDALAYHLTHVPEMPPRGWEIDWHVALKERGDNALENILEHADEIMADLQALPGPSLGTRPDSLLEVLMVLAYSNHVRPGGSADAVNVFELLKEAQRGAPLEASLPWPTAVRLSLTTEMANVATFSSPNTEQFAAVLVGVALNAERVAVRVDDAGRLSGPLFVKTASGSPPTPGVTLRVAQNQVHMSAFWISGAMKNPLCRAQRFVQREALRVERTRKVLEWFGEQAGARDLGAADFQSQLGARWDALWVRAVLELPNPSDLNRAAQAR